MRGCAIVMALAAVLVLVFYGFTIWTLLGTVILLACPVYVFWGVAELDAPLPKPEDSSQERAP
jgi:hypothetical protein